MRIAFFILVPLAGLLHACTTDKQSAKDQSNGGKIPVVNVIEKEISLDRLYVSDIQAARNVEIRSRISGFLENIHVDEGQTVKKGQLLFEISAAEYTAEVAKAKASLKQILAEAKTVELEAERVQLLVDKKIVSRTELDMANAKLNAMKAKADECRAVLDHALTRLSYTSVRAPYDGIVDRIPLKAGSLLEEGTLITSVSDISSVLAYFSISENEYLDYLRSRDLKNNTAENEVELILSDGKRYDLTGTIETVVSEFEEHTGSIAFRARFPNPNHLLKHGATGKIKLSTDMANALLVPQKAVFEIQDKNYVFVVNEDNKVQMRNFVPQTRIGKFYVVSSGLKKGEKVVYEGIQNIKDGMNVAPDIVHADTVGLRNIL